MKRLAILGAGSWGTALAIVLAPRFESVSLWVHDAALAVQMERTRENATFLPGFPIPPNIRARSELRCVLERAEAVLGVVPSHVVREVYGAARPFLLGKPIVSATKGLEAVSLLRMSEVIQEVLGSEQPVAVLSGPSFAREVASGSPTAIVLAAEDQTLVGSLQSALSGPTLRVYASADPIGVELGGALKNVIAIAAGMCEGLGLGHNAVAAVVTRGLAELMRLAEVCGAQRDTLSGLAGLGDLVLTCTGDLSRNRQVGVKLASGFALGEIHGGTPMVAEGVKTTAAAVDLAARFGVEMPIVDQVHAVLNLGRSPHAAISQLMSRTLRSETEKR